MSSYLVEDACGGHLSPVEGLQEEHGPGGGVEPEPCGRNTLELRTRDPGPGTREEPGHAAGRGFSLSFTLTRAQVTVGLKHATLCSSYINSMYVLHMCVCVCPFRGMHLCVYVCVCMCVCPFGGMHLCVCVCVSL